EIADLIHDNPEISLKEYRAQQWLTEFLERKGFRVEKGIGGLETSFRASYGSGSPTIAVLCEYDALPDVGHGCGHDLIGAMGVVAGAAVKSALGTRGAGATQGTIVVMGTPGEEAGGGKIILLEKGAFKGVDAAIMVHPSTKTMTFRPSLAAVSVSVTFKGKAAHAAGAPHEGINALEAMILTFNGLNALRQHLRDDVKIHGIITKGGAAPNVVPDYAAGEFLVRAKDRAGLDEVVEKVRRCVQGAGLMTGATPHVDLGLVYAERKNNEPMAERFGRYMAELGMSPEDPGSRMGLGSSDMGNVSQEIPAIHPYVAVTAREIPGHSREFAEATREPRARDAMLVAAKATAMTCIDLLCDPLFMDRVRKNFKGA
ncbi:MAG: M20 family metallopeptidase, partial [Firmicutes bacterium]|nr:M20 family metallopeptidase [Bacillota bacterium]